MAITLDHTIVPARDKDAAARQFAQVFGLVYGSAPWGAEDGMLNDWGGRGVYFKTSDGHLLELMTVPQ